MKKYRLLFALVFVGFIYGKENQAISDFQRSSEKYMTDENGNILMNVNIWGHVNNPGSHKVFDGIDFATLLSIVGGPKRGANMKKIKLFREIPDENEKLTYELNLNTFLKDGDRSGFIKIMPNDTIVIEQTTGGMVLSQIGTINMVLSLLTLYFQIANYAG
tara:strand:- start:91 stop:573 length:483 start_codon:yes stop_codon:yes gene_type:complete